jgi:hypothetical protein
VLLRVSGQIGTFRSRDGGRLPAAFVGSDVFGWTYPTMYRSRVVRRRSLDERYSQRELLAE